MNYEVGLLKNPYLASLITGEGGRGCGGPRWPRRSRLTEECKRVGPTSRGSLDRVASFSGWLVGWSVETMTGIALPKDTFGCRVSAPCGPGGRCTRLPSALTGSKLRSFSLAPTPFFINFSPRPFLHTVILSVGCLLVHTP